MAYQTKCDCPDKNDNGTCKNHSLIKMQFLLKNGCDDLKWVNSATGRLVNPTYYSYTKQNNIPVLQIVAGMKRRFANDPLHQFSNRVQFRYRDTGEEIKGV